MWASSIIGDFIVGSGAASLRNAHLNVPMIPLMILDIAGILLILASIILASKYKVKTPELELSNA